MEVALAGGGVASQTCRFRGLLAHERRPGMSPEGPEPFHRRREGGFGLVQLGACLRSQESPYQVVARAHLHKRKVVLTGQPYGVPSELAR